MYSTEYDPDVEEIDVEPYEGDPDPDVPRSIEGTRQEDGDA